jgi:hypothetical protein
MHISKNVNFPKEIIGIKEFNDALKQMGGDVTLPPIYVEETNVIWIHIALRGTLVQKT